jgi:hypothetical protein
VIPPPIAAGVSATSVTPPNCVPPAQPPQPPRLSSIWPTRDPEPGSALVDDTCQRIAPPGATPITLHGTRHSIETPSALPQVPLSSGWPAGGRPEIVPGMS